MNVPRHYALGVLAIVVWSTAVWASEPAVVLQNDDFSYRVGPTGRILGFVDKRTGKDYCAQPGVRPCLTLTKHGVCYEPTACSYAEGKLSVSFGQAGATVIVRVACKGRYLVLEVASVSDPDVEQLDLANLSVTCSKYVAAMSGVAADEDFAVCLRALNLQVQGEIGGRPALLRAKCYRQYGLVGARIALVGCPTKELREVLKQVVRAEGLPHSSLGGPWALDAEDNRSSYVFATVSAKNVDQWIDLAKKANLGYIHFVGWERTLGHYEPRADLFPGGLAGLKAVVAKIHAASLKAGMHTLTGCISPADRWVTPVPDRRLDHDAQFTLATALDQQAGAVITAEPPGSFDTVFAYGSRGNVIRIDDELLMFKELSRKPPYGFTGCTRGAFRTKSAPHTKGARIEHLVLRWGQFHPDENSTLVDDVAEAIARVYNGCGFDMIYMDGVTEDTMSGGWHAAAKMRRAIFDRLRQPALVEASCWDYHSWPFHSRLGAWDHPAWALKRFIDVHCRLGVLDVDGRTTERFPQASLLPSQLGWWVILGPNRDHRGETPDEMEYFCAKALGHDAPVSFEGVSVDGKPWNARQDEYLAMFGRYERLRLAGYFPASIRARLRQEKADFHLVQAADGAWKFLPADYAAHKVTGTDDGSDRWSYVNRFVAQPLKLRIEALYSVEPYDTPGAPVLADFTHSGEFSSRSAAARVTCSLTPSTEQVKVGPASGRFVAANPGASAEGAWAKAQKAFSPEIDLSRYDALGLWIHGDGKGQLLNVQLTNPPQYWEAWDEHYVQVDFQGWRYFALPLRERDAEQYGNYRWPYGGHYAVYRSALWRQHTSALGLYFNNLPPRAEATCYLSPIKALKAVKAKLANPAVEIGGRRIAFPVMLASGDYLELEAGTGCRHYDERGTLLGEVKPQGDVPLLAAGSNRIRFTCEGPADLAARAEVTLIGYGDPVAK